MIKKINLLAMTKEQRGQAVKEMQKTTKNNVKQIQVLSKTINNKELIL